MTTVQTNPPPLTISSHTEKPWDCACWYNKRGQLLLWHDHCPAHPGAPY